MNKTRELKGSLVLFHLFQKIQNFIHQIFQFLVGIAPLFVFFAFHVLRFNGVQFCDLDAQLDRKSVV